jgi:hypothetical protein
VVDRGALRSGYRTVLLKCLALSVIPPLLVGVTFIMASDGPLGEDLPDTRILWIFGLMALIPLVFVPLQRFVIAPRALAKAKGNVASVIAGQASAEYATWFLSPLLGFLLVVLTGRWEWFWAALGLWVVGVVVSFPRLARLERLADQYDAQSGVVGVITPH